MRDELANFLEVDDRERTIIFKRFGLDGGKPETLEEVERNSGDQRIRQLQNIALAKLRRARQEENRTYGATPFNSSTVASPKNTLHLV